ncbi:uncharacterized protein C20orf204 homolog isoform X2 [Lathamus discolor]|uniref:uncharacterized protein C20orf204 homolog isoform X2 n=1 Tax=Lathamus discolor TaxID=678569 RepID=UPI0032B77699
MVPGGFNCIVLRKQVVLQKARPRHCWSFLFTWRTVPAKLRRGGLFSHWCYLSLQRPHPPLQQSLAPLCPLFSLSTKANDPELGQGPALMLLMVDPERTDDHNQVGAAVPGSAPPPPPQHRMQARRGTDTAPFVPVPAPPRAPGPGPGRRVPSPPRRPGPSPPTVEPSSNRGPRRSRTRPREPPQGARPRGSMISPRALSCAVVLLLLLTVLSRGKRCSIARILRQYRAVIFHEIQNLKTLSGSVDRSGRAGPACRSDKDQKILFSIYNITMALWEAAAGSLRGPEELALWKVARNTEVVFRGSCRSIRKSPPRIPAQPWHRGHGRRRKMLREVGRKAQRLVTCWEKLYALHALHRVPRDS